MLLIIIVYILLINCIEALYSIGVKTAACRAACMDEFEWMARTENYDYDQLCQMSTECSMCWEYCELLNKNPEVWEPMCGDTTVCFEGCRIACTSFKTDISLNSLIGGWFFPDERLEAQSDESGHFMLLKWAPAVPMGNQRPPLPTVIYVLFWFDHRSKIWLQLNQTSNRFYKLFDHRQIRKNDLQILAVSKSGLVGKARFLEQMAINQSTSESILVEKRPIDVKIVFSTITVFLVLVALVGCLTARYFIRRKFVKKSLNRSNAMKIKRKSFSPSRLLATV